MLIYSLVVDYLFDFCRYAATFLWQKNEEGLYKYYV